MATTVSGIPVTLDSALPTHWAYLDEWLYAHLSCDVTEVPRPRRRLRKPLRLRSLGLLTDTVTSWCVHAGSQATRNYSQAKVWVPLGL